MKNKRWLLLAVPLCFAAMCEDDDDVLVVPCTPVSKPAMVVYLYDEAETPLTLPATVTAVDGTESFPLVYNTAGNNYQGPVDRTGTYVLQINADGYLTHESNPITVSSDGCNVNTQTLDIHLVAE